MALLESDDPVFQLTQLGRRCCARIVSIGTGDDNTQLSIRRLRQIGFEEDKEVEILHTGPFGRDPIAVRVDRMVLAIRRAEASLITVKAS